MKADSAMLRVDAEDTGKDTDAEAQTFRGGKADYGDVTTVLLSLRVPPTDDENRLVTPYTLAQDVKTAWAQARDKLPNDGVLAYYWTLAGTQEWATPHVHCYAYHADPTDDVMLGDYRPVVETFCTSSTFAQPDDHFEDGQLRDGEAVRIEHDPLLADPEEYARRAGETGAFADVLHVPRLHDNDVQSLGAIYVGTQLPELALYGPEADPDTECAAILDVASDGRQTARGNRAFYIYADALDAIRNHERGRATG